ncbi:IS110 family transposase [Enterococcus sp. DIV1420a]|uniref:IS110 family transposase n=1 Tax=Enterococcus sp. DIV1420a TaxID=2774672 RepID=UPI003F27F38D
MIYIGIGVARKKHDICILNQFSTVLLDGLTITNDKAGVEALIENVTRIQKETTDVALEATGHYSNNILLFLDSLWFPVRVFNPLTTNLFRKYLSLRKNKNR